MRIADTAVGTTENIKDANEEIREVCLHFWNVDTLPVASWVVVSIFCVFIQSSLFFRMFVLITCLKEPPWCSG